MTAVLIVEDVAETRRWLTEIAGAAFPGCRAVATDSVGAALRAAAREPFEIALIDLGLPDGSGVDVVRHLRETQPTTLCVVTTVMGDDASIVAALSAGANGYLLKEQPPARLIQQITQLVDGVPALSPSIARRIMNHFRHTGPVTGPDDALTAREREVLGLISRGLRNVDVARDLAMAESTVASHLKSIYRKLDISSRAEASWHAARMGLLSGDGQGGPSGTETE